MHFTALPTDVLLYICGELLVKDILTLRQTCKLLEQISRQRSVWNDALRAHVLERGYPIPGLQGQPLASLPSEELERLTLRALCLHRNWTAARPTCMRRAEIVPTELALTRARNAIVQFLPGRNGRWLLTLTMYDQAATLGPRRWILQCWDVSTEEQEPRCCAEFAFLNFCGLCVNTDAENEAAVALSRRGPSEIITTTVFNIDFGYRKSISLSGSALVMTDEDNIVRLMNVETGKLEYELMVPLLHEDPTVPNEACICLDALIIKDFAVTFCKKWIHLYHLETRGQPEADAAVPEVAFKRLDPVASHQWQWRIDSVVVCSRRIGTRWHEGNGGTQRASQFPFIDILVRFDTWFPWPVNILHHFVLPSNPLSSFMPSSAKTSSEQLPYLYSTSPADGPLMLNSIPSPVRLFTPSDMVLGRYGTALWLDAQTALEGPAQAGDHGQRIAGKTLVMPRAKMAQSVGEAWSDRVSPGYQEAEDASELTASKTSAAWMVFNMRMDDGWNKLAMDEEEGRIAIGSIDGSVILYEYI